MFPRSSAGSRIALPDASASARARFAGKTAPEVLLAARSTLRTQRRGMILFHWPDADRAGHQRGWMSNAYEEACHTLDGTLGMLHALAQIADDPNTLLIACADHGGGGVVSNNHDSDHPFDRTDPRDVRRPVAARTAIWAR